MNEPFPLPLAEAAQPVAEPLDLLGTGLSRGQRDARRLVNQLCGRLYLMINDVFDTANQPHLVRVR